ncbi:F1F0-ATPase complex assembly protein [Metschnikowia bicuspidata var. bicuspidata NRRL YB-4993]|uniref:F1F0-ATPase complex assembly protein n=1 Tax=Metschnikowia bicuspidata var. bicuspidata NRRL YB-4993 TaxID=869754 RepID=A0A1A0HBI3_9ASCO|nr:F1F0-ATPase complex assembly protein [Metschnikowia bicuspidata var. bicuspidata NRRL YB-4993]OBA21237.1 F1F0-ATPase complex assembly protein [Metschnikowia bicuspidata var. bicuspidata NRRL YB-4993]
MYARNLLRLASRSASRLYATASQNEAVLERYRSQLHQKAEAIGVSSIEELKENLKDEITTKKKEMNAIDPLKDLEAYEKEQAEKLKQRKAQQKESKIRDAIDASMPKAPYKKLSSFVDVEKIRSLPEKELKFIWKARFEGKDRAMSAALTGSQFANLFANAFKNPSFVLPLPKEEEGYEMHFVQWSFVGPQTTHCMLTSLAEYKLHKEYAKPHTTLMFHQELLADADVVLMNGQLEQDVALSMEEALLLVLNVQRFYGGLTNSAGSERKLELLRAFTQGDTGFSMEKLIEEAASLD